MAKTKVEVAQTPETEVTPEPEVEPQPSVDELKTQLEAAQTQMGDLEKKWKDAQRVANKKHEEAQRADRRWEEIDDIRDEIKILAAAIAQATGRSEDEFTRETQERKTDLLGQFDTIRSKRKAERLQEQVVSYQKKTEALGLKAGDKDYEDIRRFVETGLFDMADERITGITDRKETEAKTTMPLNPESKKVEPTEEEKEKWARDYLEKQGKLPVSTSGPSASGIITRDEINRRMSEPGGLEWFKKHEAEIDRLHRGGKL